MFNVKHPLEASIELLGGTWNDLTEHRLGRFERFLIDEAGPAGGIGPIEPDRVWDRHIVDSLAFSAALPPRLDSVLDLGSGVGLPGVPLAIIRPTTRFVLVDRSQRRADLCRRASRILELPNVEVVCADHRDLHDEFEGLVMRAALPVAESWEALARLLAPGGVAAVGWSATSGPPDDAAMTDLGMAAQSLGMEIQIIEPGVLDSRAAILRITAT